MTRVAIVTGGSRGIGEAISLKLKEQGVTVVANYGGNDEKAREFTDRTGIAAIKWDVGDHQACLDSCARIAEEFGPIDIVVNNAGINVDGTVEELSDTAFARCLDVNVTGVFRVCQAAIPYLKESAHGRIINAASFAAIVPSVGSAAYAASKAAVVQFTRVLAGELGPWNVTVNAYAPGMIPTGMNGFADLPADAQSRLLDTLTLRRWGDAAEVADLVLFLASDASRYITGTLIDVSGGKFATQIPAKAYERAGLL